MRRVSWSAQADADLRQVETWLAKNRPPAFELRTLQRIYERCMFLLSFPSGGPMIDGLRRKLIVTGSPYVLVYRTSGNDIEILRLFHQSEDWRAKL